MKKRLLLILLFTAATCIAPIVASEVATEGAEPGLWTMDFDAAKKVAKEKDLPLLLNFTGSDWCGWCKLMDSNVFASSEWQDYAAKKLLLVTIDFPNDKSIVPEKFVERNEKLQSEFNIEGYPTYVLLDSDAKTVLARLGAGQEKTAETFAAEVDAALAFRPAAIEAKVKSLGPMQGEKYRNAIRTLQQAENELEDWIETRPERNAENEKKFEAAVEKINSAKKALAEF